MENFPAIDRALAVLRSIHSPVANSREAANEDVNISKDSIEFGSANEEQKDQNQSFVEISKPRSKEIQKQNIVVAPYVHLKAIVSPTIIRRLYVPTYRELKDEKIKRLNSFMKILNKMQFNIQNHHYFVRWKDFVSFIKNEDQESKWIQFYSNEKDFFEQLSFDTFLNNCFGDDKKKRKEMQSFILRRYGKDKLAHLFCCYMKKFRVFRRLKVCYLVAQPRR